MNKKHFIYIAAIIFMFLALDNAILNIEIMKQEAKMNELQNKVEQQIELIDALQQ